LLIDLAPRRKFDLAALNFEASSKSKRISIVIGLLNAESSRQATLSFADVRFHPLV
jgi:hypothetical protein